VENENVNVGAKEKKKNGQKEGKLDQIPEERALSSPEPIL